MFFDFNIHAKLSACDIRTVYNYRLADWNGLSETLRLTDLMPSINSTDIDSDWQQWMYLFLGAVADHIPVKTFKRKNTPPWLDNEIKHLLKKKETARRKAKKTGKLNIHEKFRALRRQAKKLIAEKRKEWFQGLPNLLKSNSKKFWSSFKSSTKQSSIPSEVMWTRSDVDSIKADKPADIANLFNNYFYTVYKPPCSASVYEELLPSNQLNLHLQHISQLHLSPGEVLDVLHHLDVSKATGPDKIPAKLLKNCAPCISNSLCAIFNKCLHLGKLPAAWKVANIIPIPKSGHPGEVSNYRPISLLPIVSKVMERCVYNRLIEDISGQLYNLQHGFLKGKSTTSQLLEVLNEIGEMLDNRVQVDTIYLDFAKAFDRVDHHLLLKKLHLFGISGSLFCWFSDYLSNRFQQVTVLGKTSNLLPVISGVPQGSILGPLMFLIYVNDLATVSVNSSIALFADDTKCYRPVMNIDDGRLLQEDLDRITLWCQDWRMDLNQSKCTVMSITRNVSPVISSYMLQNAPVQRNDAQKDLGILVCKDLKWNCHVLEAASKANRMLGFIRRSTLEVKIQSTRKALYKALVMSNLSYSSQVWAPQSVKLIEIIERVQRRATKYILSLPYRTDISYKERLRLTELIPLCYWHEYLDLVYTYKSIANNTDTQFKISKPIRVTRRTASSKSVLLDIPKAKTVTFQNSFYSRASRTFNTLPEYLRDNTQSINVFKTKLRKHYVDLTLTVYDPAVPQTFKSVCIKCHMTRPLTALLVKLCC